MIIYNIKVNVLLKKITIQYLDHFHMIVLVLVIIYELIPVVVAFHKHIRHSANATPIDIMITTTGI